MMQSTHASISKLLSIISNSAIRKEILLIFSIISIAHEVKGREWQNLFNSIRNGKQEKEFRKNDFNSKRK
jgi:hypothetical protein